MNAATAFRDGRRALLADLIEQLPNAEGRMRAQTERAIKRLELELAPGRAAAAEAVAK
jgi:hypothetical protein